MERVRTLIEKLQQQIQNDASASQLLLTTQMLQHELLRLRPQETEVAKKYVEVAMPLSILPLPDEKAGDFQYHVEDVAETVVEEPIVIEAESPIQIITPEPEVLSVVEPEPQAEQANTVEPIAEQIELPELLIPDFIPIPEFPGTLTVESVKEELSQVPEKEEKIIQVLQVDEAELEAELEEIKKNAAAIQKISVQSKPQLLFDPFADDLPPTLQLHETPKPVEPAPKEINDTVKDELDSLNDRLKVVKTELSDILTDSPIKDLKKAIGVNDRFLFINELFRGDEAMYERSIKTINSFSIYPEAEYWIRRELKTKLGWSDQQEVVRQFDQLIRRRFA